MKNENCSPFEEGDRVDHRIFGFGTVNGAAQFSWKLTHVLDAIAGLARRMVLRHRKSENLWSSTEELCQTRADGSIGRTTG